MDRPAPDVIVVGAGVSGLAAAHALRAAGRHPLVLEARDRIGGRVLTRRLGSAGFDLGPAWIWPRHQPHLAAILDRLGLTSFPQDEQGDGLWEASHSEPPLRMPFPQRHADSARLEGGLAALTDRLAQGLHLRLGHRVTAIDATATGVTVSGDGPAGAAFHVHARTVILALPPRLAVRIAVTPTFPAPLVTAMNATPTWMAPHAKAIAVYERPFWRDAGLSGTALSRVGPLMEIVDHSPDDPAGPFALFGFFGWPRAARVARGSALADDVRRQLVRLFGTPAGTPMDLIIHDWAADPLVATDADQVFLDAHPSYGHKLFEQPWFDGRLILAGAETSVASGGLVEGALLAGDRAARLALDGLMD